MLTYILGAGASWGSWDKKNGRTEGIANVEAIPTELEELKEFIHKVLSSDINVNPHLVSLLRTAGTNQSNGYKLKDDIFADIDWLKDNIKNQLSIDTFAKKLWLRNETNSLAKLKIIYYTFLLFQEHTCTVDRRYDGLLASLINKEGRNTFLPSDVNFITWNYDVQLKRSAASFIDPEGSIPASRRLLNEINPLTEVQEAENISKFIRLNGSPEFFETYDRGSNVVNQDSTNYIDTIKFNPNF